jgi:hypothetical protein
MGVAFHSLQFVMRWFNKLDRQEWLIVLVVAMLFGFLCMRGYGSRSNY